ncbi:MAG: zinc metallopeptidase [Ruminococcaceae bacterium]|nr:zinc metallopeptidase [Oscillospiraceae bacterium]
MFFGYGYYMDSGIILVLIAGILSVIASFKVNSTFKKYSNLHTGRNITGEQAARSILDANGLYHVKVERVAGNLTDHYDPKANVIRLSDSVHSSTSVAAVGVAAHEAGHAVQHATNYKPIQVRNSIVPVANIGSMAGPYLVILGLLMSSGPLAYAGIIFFSLAVIFQLVTLPVEFNASSRAIATLENDGYLESVEVPAVKKVLGAAAMTYVAAAAVSIAQLLRLVMLVGRRDD